MPMKTNLYFHPLVEKTRKSINISNLDKGCIRGGRGALDIRVAPNSLDRALNIMDSIFKKLEEKGAVVTIKEKDYKSIMCVMISGETLAIDMYEKINIIKRGQDQHGFNRYDYIPNGTLVLRIKDAPYGARSEWKDGQEKRLEARIDSFINGLSLAAEKQKANKLKREKEAREWEEKAVKAEEEKIIRQQEQALLDALEKEAMDWHKSKIIRSYIEAVATAHIQKYGKIEPGSEFDKWRTWANEQASRLDPLSKIGR